MRAVSFVKRLQWDLPGTVFRHGLTIGDVDNDGDNELVVGTAEGELYIFKASELWQRITGLGLITCVAIGDIFNYGRNALVVICGDGWAHIFYSPRPVNPAINSIKETLQDNYKSTLQSNIDIGNSINSMSAEQVDNGNETNELSGKMECVHVQRIPTNTKVVLIADVDRDGANEMIIGLTDRVVRSYRWSSNADLGTGKLVGLNKWECANQIGTVTLQHAEDGTPTLLVAQPGGTFMRIKCNPDDCQLGEDSCELNSEAAASCVDYQTLGSSRMRNPNISTEIMGDIEPGNSTFVSDIECRPTTFATKSTPLKQNFLDDSQIGPKSFKPASLEFRRNFSQPEMRKASLDVETMYKQKESSTRDYNSDKFYNPEESSSGDQVDGNFFGGNVILGEFESDNKKTSLFPSYQDFTRDKKNKRDFGKQQEIETEKNDSEKKSAKGKPYALATLDGTIMLVKNENILWAMQVDHQIFALCRLDVTRDGADEIVACTWDGQTYILDQQRNSVRFQFEEPVRAFATGNYSVTPGISTPCLVYHTFSNKIFIYYDVILPSLLITSLNPTEDLDSDQMAILDELLNADNETQKQQRMQQFTEWLLYSGCVK